MTTIRRELRTKFEELLIVYQDRLTVAECEATAELLADAALELRGFKQTDEERPAYNFGLDWKLGHGQEVTQHDLDAANVIDQGPKMFEKAFGFGTLPWDSTPEWTNLRKFVAEIYSRDKLAFGNYIVWRATEGKYTGMSNKQIRLNPKVFMDTGWPEFSSAQAPGPQETPAAYKPYVADDSASVPNYLPKPNLRTS